MKPRGRNQLLCAVTLIGACWLAACAGRIPLPQHLRAASLSDLLDRMGRAAVNQDAFTAEVRLTYFGPEGRVRGTASLAAKRPDRLRYELHGPTGVLAAFATDGRELQLADLKSSRFFYGPATAENIDELLGIARLGLNAEAWVALLFGEIAVPASAELTYDDQVGLFVIQWEDHRVAVDPQTARVVRASLSASGALVSEVEIRARDAAGLAVELRLQVLAQQTDVELRLRDVSYAAELDDALFRLDPPRNVVPEYLGTTSGAAGRTPREAEQVVEPPPRP